MFELSKALAVLTEPLVYVAALLLWGLISHSFAARLRSAAFIAAFAAMCALGFEAIPNALEQKLESSHVAAPDDLTNYAGMVVLEGAFTKREWRSVRDLAVNDAGERATVPVALLRTFPGLKIVFSGGDSDPGNAFARAVADRARVFFNAMGVPPDAVIYERESRSTTENAIFSSRVAAVNIRELGCW